MSSCSISFARADIFAVQSLLLRLKSRTLLRPPYSETGSRLAAGQSLSCPWPIRRVSFRRCAGAPEGVHRMEHARFYECVRVWLAKSDRRTHLPHKTGKEGADQRLMQSYAGDMPSRDISGQGERGRLERAAPKHCLGRRMG